MGNRHGYYYNTSLPHPGAGNTKPPVEGNRCGCFYNITLPHPGAGWHETPDIGFSFREIVTDAITILFSHSRVRAGTKPPTLIFFEGNRYGCYYNATLPHSGAGWHEAPNIWFSLKETVADIITILFSRSQVRIGTKPHTLHFLQRKSLRMIL